MDLQDDGIEAQEDAGVDLAHADEEIGNASVRDAHVDPHRRHDDRHRGKIPLLLKAGMGMEMLDQIDRSIEAVDDEEQALRVMAWNGIVFNCIRYWAARGFADVPDELADRMAAITTPLFDEEPQ